MPLAIASIRPPSNAGIRPLNSIPLIADCTFSFSLIAAIMSTSNPTAVPLSIVSKGGNVAAAPQVSLPASTSGSVCASDAGARRNSARSAGTRVERRSGMRVSK
jgi:hypothetical protein